jgi:hypothetical protein
MCSRRLTLVANITKIQQRRRDKANTAAKQHKETQQPGSTRKHTAAARENSKQQHKETSSSNHGSKQTMAGCSIMVSPKLEQTNTVASKAACCAAQEDCIGYLPCNSPTTPFITAAAAKHSTCGVDMLPMKYPPMLFPC